MDAVQKEGNVGDRERVDGPKNDDEDDDVVKYDEYNNDRSLIPVEIASTVGDQCKSRVFACVQTCRVEWRGKVFPDTPRCDETRINSGPRTIFFHCFLILYFKSKTKMMT